MSYYQIKIKEPCHENWNTMSTNEQGKFCEVCTKEVVDFTTMTDQEVKDYVSNYKGSLCGRFNNIQLEKKDQRYHSLSGYAKQFIRAFAMVFIMFTSCNTNSDSHTMGEIVEVDTKTINCTGMVFDYNGIGVQQANITIAKDGKEVAQLMTNNNGEYSIRLAQDDYDIKITKSEYEPLETSVAVSDTGTFGDFELQSDHRMEILGDISIEMGEATIEDEEH